jgi:hypothetical protein
MGLDPRMAPLQARWNKISERIRKIKDLRDRLAHHSVDDKNARLQSSQFDLRQKTKRQHPLDLTEVYEFFKTIVAICDDLRKYCEDLQVLISNFPSEEKSVEPTPGHSPKSGAQ